MADSIRERVRKRYGEIAKKIEEQGSVSCCCSSNSCCSGSSNAELLYDTDSLKGLPADAVAASLGCANPLLLAELKEGETVLDLGSGGGIDALAASRYVGPTGKVYGLDMTDEMLELANRNKERMGATNVTFIKGYIEQIPLPDGSVDVVMSNCVINLSENKGKVLQEAHRVLKEGGRLAVADIVALKPIPDGIRTMAELWVGCMAGALEVATYQQLLILAGFRSVEITPIHVYTREVIQTLVDKRFNLSDCEWDLIDGAFAGAQVKGIK